jgi:hypothetical protein
MRRRGKKLRSSVRGSAKDGGWMMGGEALLRRRVCAEMKMGRHLDALHTNYAVHRSHAAQDSRIVNTQAATFAEWPLLYIS